jgi:hypothetical protein
MLSWSWWESKLRVPDVRLWRWEISTTLPGHQRRPNSREPETYVTHGGGEGSSTPILRVYLVFVIRWITSSTLDTSQSAKCEFYPRQDPTIFR